MKFDEKIIVVSSIVFGTLSFPHVVQAQVRDFADFVGLLLNGILNPLIVIIITLALIYFLWGMANFILRADDEQARAKGKQIMIWGIIALFVMVSVWALVAILENTFL